MQLFNLNTGVSGVYRQLFNWLLCLECIGSSFILFVSLFANAQLLVVSLLCLYVY